MPWRKFGLLVRRLPMDSSLRLSALQEEDYRSGAWWKRQVDEKMGREYVPRQRTSVDGIRKGL